MFLSRTTWLRLGILLCKHPHIFIYAYLKVIGTLFHFDYYYL